MPKRPNFAKIADDLRDRALCYPGTDEHFPWGETAIKVKGKTFLLRSAEHELSLSVKLPRSREDALSFKRGDDVPVGVLADWIDESYRAVAPKKLVVQLPVRG